MFASKKLLFYEFLRVLENIIRTLFTFNFYVFSKLTFDIDIINVLT